MPSAAAHYLFGKEVLPSLPDHARQCIQRFRRMYDMGLQGPDFLFYNLLPNSKDGKLSHEFHMQTGREFFGRACAAASSEAARAYLYGVLGHYCLDSQCHPFIRRMHSSGEAIHAALESEFDRFLMAQRGYAAPHTYRISKHLKVTRGECMTIADFYPPVSGGKVRRDISMMIFARNFLSGGNRERREKLLCQINPALRSYFIPQEPVEGYTRMVSELLARYNRCVKLYPQMLEELSSHMELGVPLGERFNEIFG